MDSKISCKISCDLCHYNTCKKTDYAKHIVTIKHLKMINGSKTEINGSENSQNISKIYRCNCGKIYKYDSGYYRHKKNVIIMKNIQ